MVLFLLLVCCCWLGGSVPRSSPRARWCEHGETGPVDVRPRGACETGHAVPAGSRTWAVGWTTGRSAGVSAGRATQAEAEAHGHGLVVADLADLADLEVVDHGGVSSSRVSGSANTLPGRRQPSQRGFAAASSVVVHVGPIDHPPVDIMPRIETWCAHGRRRGTVRAVASVTRTTNATSTAGSASSLAGVVGGR